MQDNTGTDSAIVRPGRYGIEPGEYEWHPHDGAVDLVAARICETMPTRDGSRP